MKLSIITINYNDAEALSKTIKSVKAQSFNDYEHVIVDGGSTDESVEIIRKYAQSARRLKYVSERDNGIYDAQNKGIGLSEGDYCFFLNAGDVFASTDVLSFMFKDKTFADIVYGNLRVVSNGKIVGYCKGVNNPTFLDLFNSCLKHQATFIRRELFDRFGLYDISLRIVADWDWFFRVAGFNNEVILEYRNVDVVDFDNEGISNRSPQICKIERQTVLNKYMSKVLQQDYELLNKYRGIRFIDKFVLSRFFFRIIAKFSKIIQERKK